jgi:TRAP-type C4-dicarboxylate transport system permease small subunit
MDKKGSIQSSVLLYIILMVIAVILIIIFLQFFTPYKFSTFIESLFSGGTSIKGGNYQ